MMTSAPDVSGLQGPEDTFEDSDHGRFILQIGFKHTDSLLLQLLEYFRGGESLPFDSRDSPKLILPVNQSGQHRLPNIS
jgi:hypothetical protein